MYDIYLNMNGLFFIILYFFLREIVIQNIYSLKKIKGYEEVRKG